MPGGTRTQLGNEQFAQILYLPVVAFPTLGANTSATTTFTCSGVLVGDLISTNLQAPIAHLFLENAYVSAPNTIIFSWTTDSSGVTGANVAVIMDVTRGENSSLGLTALPSTIT